MRTSIQTRVIAAGIVCAAVLTAGVARAHCEIPCGIYGDRMRIDLLKEDIQTVEKSMQQIKLLEKPENANMNQLVRWVTNKEEHANKIQEIVYQYFMNQRIKPVDKSDEKAYDAYITQITLLHRMLVESMKCKQTTDESHITALRQLVTDFEKAYFPAEEHAHKGDEHTHKGEENTHTHN